MRQFLLTYGHEGSYNRGQRKEVRCVANMLDYLTWRGDLLFSRAELNDVDGLILSELAYIRFDGLVSESMHYVEPIAMRLGLKTV